MTVFLSDYFKEDIESIKADPDFCADVAEILAFVEALQECPNHVHNLNRQDKVIYDPWGNVSLIHQFQKLGYVLYRLKPLPAGGVLGKYRFIYANDLEYPDDYYFFALVKKVYINGNPDPRYPIYDYSVQNETTKRVFSEYEAYELPMLSSR